MRILIIGAGGHAQVVADILQRAHAQGHPARPIGYLDDNPTLIGQARLGLSILGPVVALSTIPHDAIILAVGSNATRYKLYQHLHAQNEQFAVACHPSAIIAPDVRIGYGTVICAGVIVNPGSVIGNNVILNTGCTIDHHNRLQDHVHIAPGAHLGGDVEVSEGALIGIGAIVMPQRKIGSWSMVGAAALAQRDVVAYQTVVGVPARPLQR